MKNHEITLKRLQEFPEEDFTNRQSVAVALQQFFGIVDLSQSVKEIRHVPAFQGGGIRMP
jgi:hypothetical protein